MQTRFERLLTEKVGTLGAQKRQGCDKTPYTGYPLLQWHHTGMDRLFEELWNLKGETFPRWAYSTTVQDDQGEWVHKLTEVNRFDGYTRTIKFRVFPEDYQRVITFGSTTRFDRILGEVAVPTQDVIRWLRREADLWARLYTDDALEWYLECYDWILKEKPALSPKQWHEVVYRYTHMEPVLQEGHRITEHFFQVAEGLAQVDLPAADLTAIAHQVRVTRATLQARSKR